MSVKKSKSNQVMYQGRWVNKDYFRVFIYDAKGNQKLVNSYKEYCDQLETGEWFSSKDDFGKKPKVGRKPKNGTDG